MWSKAVEEIKQYRKQSLEPTLKSLHEKNDHIKNVYEYCTTSYVNASTQSEKKRVEKETMDYLLDLIHTISKEVEGTSDVILKYLEMTVELADTVSSRNLDIKT